AALSRIVGRRSGSHRDCHDECVPPRRLNLRSLRVPAAIVLLLLAAVALVPILRTPILQSAGWVLVASDPIERADVVVLAVDVDASGVLEAADLVHAGIAGAVGIFAEVVEPADLELI